MKKLKYTIATVFVSVVMASCSFLEKEPYEVTPEEYFQDEEQASRYLTGIYATLAQSTFYGNDYFLIAGGDDLTCYGGSTGRISTTGLICNLCTTSDAVVTGLWYTLYNGIERANYFIEQIDLMENISDNARAQYKSEARFLRAFYYFTLVQNWGDVPFKTESTMSTESLNNKDIARTPKDQIYQFIVDEMAAVADEETGGLKTAAQLNYKPGRISKSTAWGILARVYLFWAGEHYRDNHPEPANNIEKFRMARDYGLKVINEGGHELSGKYWDMFIDVCSDEYDTTNKHESIWEIEFAGDGTGDTRAEGRIGNTVGLQCADFSSLTEVVGIHDPGYAYAFLWSTPKLYELYGYKAPYGKAQYTDDADPKWDDVEVRDDRFIWNIAPFSYRSVSGDKSRGIVGRTFQHRDLYYWVMSEGDEFAGKGYGDRSNDYGLNEDAPVYNSTTSAGLDGDMYSQQQTTEANRDNNMRKDLCCAKFRREYEPTAKKNKNNTPINFPVLRYSDVLLMVAEAENEVNGPAEAYKYINEVRKRAGISELQGLSTDELRSEIKDERARELCFEFLRRYDLIRWGEYISSMNALVSRTGEKCWSQGEQVANFFRIPESYNYLPIPEAEMSVNKLITSNNPGW